MITDQKLDEFLKSVEDQPTNVVNLRITPKGGDDITDWQLHFNRMSSSEMYTEYTFVINQLLFAKMDEAKRLVLFDKVNRAAAILVGNLRHIYQTQPGILDEEKQQALDTVLSIYYSAIMFYHVVWQRAAANPVVEEKKGFISLFNRNHSQPTTDEIVKRCLFGMINLLRHALFEKYIGYRQDTAIIWHYLNACYRFAVSNEWQNVSYSMKVFGIAEFGDNSRATIQGIYYHCLTVAVTNPFGCRRSDIIAIQKISTGWINELIISKDLVEKPYLYIDLKGDHGPQLLTSDIQFNPFAACNDCLFIGFSRFEKRLAQAIIKGQTSSDYDIKNNARQAKLVQTNLHTILQPSTDLQTSYEQCQVVLGFQQIHYMLANKSSLGNLIQANELADRIRPRPQNIEKLNEYTNVTLDRENSKQYYLSYIFSYQPIMYNQHPQLNRGVVYSPINQIQVNSLIAIKKMTGMDKVWHLGYIRDTKQYFIDPIKDYPTSKLNLHIDIKVDLHSKNLIPCGIRIQNYGSRPPYFVPAFIVPKDPELNREQTSLLMARFGYNVEDKLIIRIDNKEVNVRLTKLLNITDDIEEYAFVRIQ